MAKAHRYVKAGIKSREAKLTAFGRRSGLLGIPAYSELSARNSERAPVGKQASYAAIGQQPPRDREAAPTPSPTSLTTATTPTTGVGAVSPYQTDRAAARAHVSTAVVATMVEETSATGNAPASDSTEQDGMAEGAIPDDTEFCPTESSIDDEGVRFANNAIQDDPEFRPTENSTDAEEAKSEDDEQIESGGFVDMDVFDGNNIVGGGARKEILFGPIARDDVIVVATVDLSYSEVNLDDKDVTEDNAHY
ncbi:hypothetical protein PHYPSEUDO_013397 [Phytophthora pseudosyringae]|uniref:Uncharacterized protein n=1 Tax=Phytophthora pseudosyringae TaxID=221518 RepID=A0A8T1V8M8_9STRA|nr:hypothetical protein PHYPSEUDO_013397 [Phytophthora pseudosyringae]